MKKSLYSLGAYRGAIIELAQRAEAYTDRGSIRCPACGNWDVISTQGLIISRRMTKVLWTYANKPKSRQIEPRLSRFIGEMATDNLVFLGIVHSFTPEHTKNPETVLSQPYTPYYAVMLIPVTN